MSESERIYIYDKDENLQLILSDNGISYDNGWFIEQLNGQVTLEFEVPIDSPELEHIMGDGRAVTRNVDGEFAEFIIRNVEDIDTQEGTVKRVEGEGGEYELIDEFLSQYRASNIPLKTALESVTQGTRWSVGHVDDLGTNSVDLKDVSVKNAIYELLNIYGAEIKYRVELVGNYIVKRYIDVYKKRGVDLGKRFEFGKDILSTSRVIDTSQVKTAMFGKGASRENNLPRVNFADVSWSVENGDPIDKPLGQTWVGDPEALQRWGYKQGSRHRFGFYDGQEEDPAELLMNTWLELQKVNKSNDTYDFKVILLEELMGYDFEKVRLGDRARMINRNVVPEVELESSVIEYRQNLNDHRLSEVTMGEFRNSNDISARLDRVERTVNERQGSWDKKPNLEDLDEVRDYAREKIEEVTKKLAQTEREIEEALIELSDAQAILDSVTENVAGVTRLRGTIATDRIISQNAVVTGTLNTSNAIFQKGSFREADILDANIRDATITGELLGVSGTFTGDVRGGTFESGYVGEPSTPFGFMKLQRDSLRFVENQIDNSVPGYNQLYYTTEFTNKAIEFNSGRQGIGGFTTKYTDKGLEFDYRHTGGTGPSGFGFLGMMQSRNNYELFTALHSDLNMEIKAGGTLLIDVNKLQLSGDHNIVAKFG